MSDETKPTTRRTFLKSTASAGAALAVADRAPAVLANAGPSDTIGVACIGVGTQGHRLLQAVQSVPSTEVRVICDLYDGQHQAGAGAVHERARSGSSRSGSGSSRTRTSTPSSIAVPDFWHAPITVAAAQNKKDVYVEKGWCVKLDEAKKMRAAVKDNKVVMQLGPPHEQHPHDAQGAGDLPLGGARQGAARAHVHRPHELVPGVAVLHRLRDPAAPGGRHRGDDRLEAVRRELAAPRAALRRRAVLHVAALLGLRHRHRRRPPQPHVGRGQHGRGDGDPRDRRHPGREVLLEGGPGGARHVARPLRLPEEGAGRHLRVQLPQQARRRADAVPGPRPHAGVRERVLPHVHARLEARRLRADDGRPQAGRARRARPRRSSASRRRPRPWPPTTATTRAR